MNYQYNKRMEPHFWEHDWHHLVNLRRGLERILAEHGLLKAPGIVVDMGCGDRPYELLFRAQHWQYICCDIDGEVDVKLVPGTPVSLADASADGVVSFQVLEHVWDIDWYLSECRRILKPGGWLLLSTHGTWLYHPHPTDFRRWTHEGLARELRDRDFAVETVEGVVGPLAWTTQFRLLGIRHVLQSIPCLGKIILFPVSIMMNVKMIIEDAMTPNSIRDTNACVFITLSRK